MYEYLASVQSAVRRINDRFMQLSKRLGNDNSIVQKFASQVDMFLTNNYRLKNGVVQITRPSDIYNDPEKMQALENIENDMPTWGALRKEAEKSYEKYVEQEKFFNTPEEDIVGIEDFVKTFTQIPDALSYMYANPDNKTDTALQIMHIKGRRKTYRELAQAIDLANQSYRENQNV